MNEANRRRAARIAGWVAIAAAVIWLGGAILIPRDVQAVMAVQWNIAWAAVFVVALVLWSILDPKLWRKTRRNR